MTLTDRHLDELKRELWRKLPGETARYSKLFLKDPQAGVDAAIRAMSFHDRRAMVAIGEAVIQRGLLDMKPLRRTGFLHALPSILVEEGRLSSALKVLEFALADADEISAKAGVLKARVLAGLGRTKEARETVREALKLEPNVRDGRELLKFLETQQELKLRVSRGDAGWPEMRRLAEAYLGLGLPAHAAKLIGEHAPDLPAPTVEDYADALELLKIALPLVGPKLVLRWTPALRPAARDDRLKALIAECCIAMGRPDKVEPDDKGGRDLRMQRALALAARGERDEALARLGRLSQKFREDLEVRAALCHQVGDHVLMENPLVLRPAGGPRRIFNLMPFNDELAILKVHLAEMADHVDLFVIVESEVTFTGQPKPLYFAQHRHEFADYAEKIRHVVVPPHPPAFDSPWGRDFRQRDLAVTAISGLAAPDDLVLLTDVDEIVAPHALEGFEHEFAGLRMALFRFFLNYRPDPANFPVRRTGAVWKAKHLQKFGSSYARFFLARRRDVPVVDNCGWHFTSMADPERLVAKINSYAHQERSVEWRDLGHVDRRLAAIRSGRLEPGWERAEIEALPAYIRERPDEFSSLLI